MAATSVQPAWRFVPQAQANWDASTPKDATYLMLKNEPLNSFILVGINTIGQAEGGGLIFEASLDGAHYVTLAGTDQNGVMQPTPYPLFNDSYTVVMFHATGFRYFHARLNPVLPGGSLSFGYMLEASSCC